ncbi:MAG: SDR family NAD(P)-dependent oxidoreductase, partial [Acidimicrobiia bacterium]
VTSSSAGLWGNFGQAAYGAAKMGLVGMIKVLAQEGRKYSITANAIAPIARTRMTEGLTGDLEERLDPSRVSPVVAYLAHESCQLSGEVISVGAGRVARVFVGVTKGYLTDDLDAETIAEHLDQVMDADGYVVPGSSGAEVELVMSMLADHAASRTA